MFASGPVNRPIPASLACAASLLLVISTAGCGKDSPPSDPPARFFVDVTAAAGLDFHHRVEIGGSHALPEIMGSGLAVFDADGDGDPDVLFLDAGDREAAGAPNRLFLQGADGTFVQDEKSGLGGSGYSMGVAVGDVDDDGDLDVWVANWGRDELFINRGDGTFEDRSSRSGIDRRDWTSSVAFLDYDLDGDLDLYAANYVIFDAGVTCSGLGGRTDYCSPKAYRACPDGLYRNRGDGTFEDVSERSGIA